MQARKLFYVITVVILVAMLLPQVLAAQTSVSDNWQIEPVGDAEHGEVYPSLVLDANGYPHIAYADFFNDDIEYAYYDGQEWHAEKVYTSGANYGAKLALDSNGNPHIIWDYYNAHNVMYAYKDGSTWHVETVHAGAWPKSHALTIDSNDRPHAIYWTDGRGDNITHAWRDGSGWNIEVVEHTSHTHTFAAIAVDALDRVHVAYSLYGDSVLKYALFDGAWHKETIDNSTQIYGPVSIDVDSSNSPHVAYKNATLNRLDYYWRDAGSWSSDTVDNAAYGYVHLKLDSLDRAHFVYLHSDGVDAYTKYTWGVPGQWNMEILPTSDANSLAIDAFNRPHISFSNTSDAYLFYATRNRHPTLSTFQELVTVDEAQVATNGGAVDDPDDDPVTLSASVGTVTNNGDETWSWSFGTSDGPIQSQTVTITADDGNGGASQVSFDLIVHNVAPVVEDITASLDPVQVNTTINASADLADPGVLDTHTAVWDWGDDSTSTGTVNETNGSGNVTGSHIYAAAGVYTVKLTVTDDDGGSGESILQYIVVYDPDGGFVTGGGWIDSPAGAYAPDPSLSGKANFGFVSKYKKGATIPSGATQFNLHVADFNFHSTSYDWLVIAGAKAKYKGEGTINGAGEYKFMITAIDADINANDSFDTDRFRIKIWVEDASGDETIVYDNGLGADDGDDDAATEIGGGSIVIHTGK